jgi:uncharacterized repeat protein (TIGR02543 family)
MRRPSGWGILLLALAVVPAAAASGTYTSRQLSLGSSGYTLSFEVIWAADDAPGSTVSSPGMVDLLDSGGNLVGEVEATVVRSLPSVNLVGPGSASAAGFSVTATAAQGSPADGYLNVTWAITGAAPGTYTLRFWSYRSMVAGSPASLVATTTLDGGGAPGKGGPPSPTPTPTPPATFTLTALASAGGAAAGGGTYPANTLASATATALSGYAFTGWTGGVTSLSPTLAVLMTSNVTVTATFAPLMGQTITVAPTGPVTTRSPAFALVATASSGLPVSLALQSGPATLQGSTVTPLGAVGTVTLLATQAGNASYLPAPPVTVTIPIGAPPAGVILGGDPSATKRSDRSTRVTSLVSAAAN